MPSTAQTELPEVGAKNLSKLLAFCFLDFQAVNLWSKDIAILLFAQYSIKSPSFESGTLKERKRVFEKKEYEVSA